jgi:dihydroceramide fatty acyl 2-hydroxylase
MCVGKCTKPIETGHAKIDPSKPLVMQVGRLGEAYDDWTHQPLPGIPRLFGPDWMEACTKTPWWLIPLLWGPLCISCAIAALRVFHLSPFGLVWRALVGIYMWHLLEYSLHRFLFHKKFTSYKGITFHFLAHGIHHKYPNDPLRLVFPLVPGVIVTTILVTTFKTLLPWSDVIALASGMIFGYIQYDCTHYFIHHGLFKQSPWFKPLRESHAEHHYRNHDKAFGVTTPFFDFVFGTWNSIQAQWVQ